MITQIATLVMLLYAVGLGFLNRTLHKHLPPISQKYVARWLRPWIALLWMWGPTVWFVPGLVWFRVLNIPQDLRLTLIGLNFFLPLFIFICFTSFVGMYPYRTENPFDMLVTYLIVGSVGILTVIFMVLLFVSPSLTIWQSIFFTVIVLLHPCIAVLTFSFAASHVIPCPSENFSSRLRSNLILITSFFSSYPKPVWVVQDGNLETRIHGNPFYGAGSGWLLTEPDNVTILGNGYNLTRIEEPGIVLTIDSESPYRIVDLRNQKRSMDVLAVTRDGIEVNIPISFYFRIDSGPGRPELNHPWPINKRDIFQAVFAEVVDPNGKTPLDDHLTHPWEDLPLKIAAYKLKQAIAFYSLFQLYEDGTTPEMQVIHNRTAAALGIDLPKDTGDSLTRKIVGEMVLTSVRQMLNPHGFYIYGGGVANSITPLSKELTRQRVEAWKTRWISKVMHWQAERQTNHIENIPEIDRGTALGFVDALIEQTFQITQLDDPVFTKQAIANNILSNLSTLAKTPAVEPLLPDSVMPTLSRLLDDAEASR